LLAGVCRLRIVKAFIAAGIRDPADFEGMHLADAPELVELEKHERDPKQIFV
jgi:hypothetical protein